jgi:hypothetical protein
LGIDCGAFFLKPRSEPSRSPRADKPGQARLTFCFLFPVFPLPVPQVPGEPFSMFSTSNIPDSGKICGETFEKEHLHTKTGQPPVVTLEK